MSQFQKSRKAITQTMQVVASAIRADFVSSAQAEKILLDANSKLLKLLPRKEVSLDDPPNKMRATKAKTVKRKRGESSPAMNASDEIGRRKKK